MTTNEAKRQKIAEELLSTERTYVEQLFVLQKVFEEPFRGNGVESLSHLILPPKTVSLIFSNLDDLIKLNKELLLQLKKRIETDEWEQNGYCLGDIFIKIVPFFKLYSIYVSNYHIAISTVVELRKQNPTILNYLKESATFSECKGLNLEAYLITPVQRIPRYRLLFQELLKNTGENHPDYTNLQKTFVVIDEVANFVNQTIKDQEETEKLLSIQKSFIGLQESLLVPGRKLIREGVLMKVCRKSSQPRIFFLFSDILLYGKIGPTGGANYVYHRTLKIESVKATDQEDTETVQNGFLIVSPLKSFKVFVETPELKEAWIKDINEMSEKRRKNQSTLKVENDSTQNLNDMRDSFLAPVWIPDKETQQCMVCNNEFSMVKRRHHCRSCGKVVCGSCSPKRAIPLISEVAIRICTLCHSSLMSQNQPEALKQTLMGFPIDGIFSDSSGSDEEGKSKRVSKGNRVSQSQRLNPRPPAKPTFGSHRSPRSGIRTSEATTISQQKLSGKKVKDELQETFSSEDELGNIRLPTPSRISFKVKQAQRRSLSCSDMQIYEPAQPARVSYGGYLDTVRRSFVQPSVSQIPGKEWNVEKKGYIEKKGLLNKSYKKRWLVAMSLAGATLPVVMGNLTYYQNENSTQPSGIIDLRDIIKVDSQENSENEFKIATTIRIYYFMCSSKEERDEWKSVIQNILDALNLGRIIAKQTSQDLVESNLPKDSILKQGLLTKQGNRYKSWKQRWFQLTPEFLTYRKDFNSKEFIDSIPLSTIEGVEDGFSRTAMTSSLAIITPKRTYVMYCDSPQDRDDWMIMIRRYAKILER